MRTRLLLLFALLALLLHRFAFGQDLAPQEILAEAERVYPDSKVPALYGPGTASYSFAGEVEDREWSSEMESKILMNVEFEQRNGLVLRRAEVECRTSTCAILLIHAAERGEGSVGNLISSLRDTYGFTGVTTSGIEIPMTIDAQVEERRAVRTWFMYGYAEVVLTGAGRAQTSTQ
jgi:hypothetical protein